MNKTYFRFCPRCAHRLQRRSEHRGEPKRQCCTQCGFTFYNNPITSNEALVVKKGKVLLVRRAKAPRKGFWDIPGGFVEGIETPQSSVAREFREELGGHFTPKFILGAYADSYYWQGRAIPTVTVAYVGSLSGRITAQREIQEAHCFPLDRIPPMAFKHQYQALRDLKAFLKKERPRRASRED